MYSPNASLQSRANTVSSDAYEDDFGRLVSRQSLRNNIVGDYIVAGNVQANVYYEGCIYTAILDPVTQIIGQGETETSAVDDA
jgi:hypothetical protein